jgi:hypothetical protein
MLWIVFFVRALGQFPRYARKLPLNPLKSPQSHSYSLPLIRNLFTAHHVLFPPAHSQSVYRTPCPFPPTHSQSLSSIPDYRATFHIPSPALSFPNYPRIAIAALSTYVPLLFYFSTILYFIRYTFPPRRTTLQLMLASARCLSNFQSYPPLCFATHNSPSHSRRSSTPRVFSNLLITSIAYTYENVLQVFQATK